MAIPSLIPLLQAPLGYAAQNDLDGYTDYTRKLNGTGICFDMKESGLKICYGDNEMAIERTDGVASDKVDWSKTPLPQLQSEKWVLGFFPRLYFLYWLNAYDVFREERVTPKTDQHAAVTREALKKFGKPVPFYEAEEPGSDLLTQLIAYRDYPPIHGGTYADIFGTLMSRINQGRHALRSLDTPQNGVPRLEDNQKVKAKIRGEMDHLLIQAHEMQKARRHKRAISSRDGIDALHRKIDQALEPLDSIQTGTEEEQKKARADLRANLKTLGPEFTYPRMRSIELPDPGHPFYENRDMVSQAIRPYWELIFTFNASLGGFHVFDQTRDKTVYRQALERYRTALYYVDEKNWMGLAEGKGPATAIGQMTLAAAIHLAQDSVAHCGNLNGEICEEQVSVNPYALGKMHTHEGDQAIGEDGRLKPSALIAADMSRQILVLAAEKDDALFSIQKRNFLNRYWPNPEATPLVSSADPVAPSDASSPSTSVPSPVSFVSVSGGGFSREGTSLYGRFHGSARQFFGLGTDEPEFDFQPGNGLPGIGR